MKPLLVNSTDLRGGAARAAYRLHRALRAVSIESNLLVQTKEGDDPTVVGPGTNLGRLLNPLRPILDLLPILAYPKRTKGTFYPGWLPDRSRKRVKDLMPDLVHLHWIAGGFVNVRALRKYRLPLVWTLHDMWAFTGGCHYDDGCGRYMSTCGSCPVLGSKSGFDLSSLNFRRKAHAYIDLPLTIVTPSRWLGELARNSRLLGGFPLSVIPNAIDTDCFRPLAKDAARNLLGLPDRRKLILFGAAHGGSEPRKGFSHLQAALRTLAEGGGAAQFTAVIFGASPSTESLNSGIECIHAGNLRDDVSLAALYAAADVYVAPSTQENLSNTVMEALACGTPCIAFDIGGMADMIEHHRNGYLARPFDAVDLAAGILWILGDDQRRMELSSRARQKVLAEFAMPVVARRHVELYQRILESVQHRTSAEPSGTLR
ncbi:MAG TPA: glycosyltransferase family 4 protein [Burkholderiales bacterium]|jgi:glycosyltransferase involved in cell wall biosynthesis|nr:glycosyltransferase family 4 protein [Burkholderiales bacterium]